MLYRDARCDEDKEGNGDTEEHDRLLHCPHIIMAWPNSLLQDMVSQVYDF